MADAVCTAVHCQAGPLGGRGLLADFDTGFLAALPTVLPAALRAVFALARLADFFTDFLAATAFRLVTVLLAIFLTLL
jgi:hypothetical protein